MPAQPAGGLRPLARVLRAGRCRGWSAGRKEETAGGLRSRQFRLEQGKAPGVTSTRGGLMQAETARTQATAPCGSGYQNGIEAQAQQRPPKETGY